MIRSHWEDSEYGEQPTTTPPAPEHTTSGTCAGCGDTKPADEQLAAEQWTHLTKYYAGGTP